MPKPIPHTTATPDPDALLTYTAAAALYGIEPQTLRKWVSKKDPRAPKPIRANKEFVRFRRRDVLAAIDRMAAGEIKAVAS